MSYLIDDVARVLASPAPRRKALKLIGGALAASLFGALGVKHAAAQTTCNPRCTSTQKCCTTSAKPFCVRSERVCCGNTSCGEEQKCCGNKVCCGEETRCTSSGTCSSSDR